MPGALAAFARGRTDVGGIASFVGTVRDRAWRRAGPRDDPGALSGHDRASARGDRGRGTAPLAAARRASSSIGCGRMLPGEAIVLVATASAHRAAALEACAFLIDWLKTSAPFWKLEETPARRALGRGPRQRRCGGGALGPPAGAEPAQCWRPAPSAAELVVELQRGIRAEQDLDDPHLVEQPRCRRHGRRAADRVPGTAGRKRSSRASAPRRARAWHRRCRGGACGGRSPPAAPPRRRQALRLGQRVEPAQDLLAHRLVDAGADERRRTPLPDLLQRRPAPPARPAICSPAHRGRPPAAAAPPPPSRRHPAHAAASRRAPRACRRCGACTSRVRASSRARAGMPRSAPRSGRAPPSSVRTPAPA